MNHYVVETSPYNLPPVYAGNYRVPQTTPSPQPLSPPNFYPVSPAPTSPYGNLGMGNILQNQLQAPRPNQHLLQPLPPQQQEQNQHLNINFQGSLQSPIFQPNQISNHNIQNNAFAPESNQWNIPNNNNNNNMNSNNNNNLNINAYSTNPNNRTLLSYNNIPHSSIFNTQSQAQNPINNLDGPSTSGTNNNNNNESRTTLSNLLDMDTQNILNNLSGDLNSLSFSDFRSHDEPMSDSFIKLKSDLHNLGKCTTNDK